MVGLSILKHLEDLSDEVLIQRWIQNPYYQSFTGEIEFQWQLPCDPSDLTYFRKRIGKEGFEKVLAASIALHQEKAIEDEMCIDTTVQEKNIPFQLMQSSTERYTGSYSRWPEQKVSCSVEAMRRK